MAASHDILNDDAIHEKALEDGPEDFFASAFASRYLSEPIAVNKFPKTTLPARVVQQMIRDARLLDANPRLNLASFVTTWMEPEVNDLIMEAINVNYIDESEYPSTTDIHNHCVAMLADLFNAEEVCGTATIGSSEGILLGGLAMKRRWQELRKAAGKGRAEPNIVCGSEVHVCWEKLFNYFEIEPRYVNLTPDCFVATPEKIAAACDENTIGVVAILGTTYSGHFEDVEGIDREIGKLNAEKGWNIPIHVDGASGAFVVPFLYPDLKWDFRLKNVVSINASGHKFGLVYPGVGWQMFRSKEYLPESLVFHENYLGTDQANFTLNFSKSAAQIVAQYYQFMRLGRPGYTKVMKNCMAACKFLVKGINDLHHFEVVSAAPKVPGLPLVAFTLLPGKRDHGYDEFDIADRLRERGWVVPAYTMAPGAESVRVLRVLCREDFSLSSAQAFLEDLRRSMDWLDSHYIYTPEQLDELKQKFVTKGVGRKTVKEILVPGEPEVDAGAIPRHGGIC